MNHEILETVMRNPRVGKILLLATVMLLLAAVDPALAIDIESGTSGPGDAWC